MLKIEARGYQSKFWRYASPILALLLTGATSGLIFAAMGRPPAPRPDHRADDRHQGLSRLRRDDLGRDHAAGRAGDRCGFGCRGIQHRTCVDWFHCP